MEQIVRYLNKGLPIAWETACRTASQHARVDRSLCTDCRELRQLLFGCRQDKPVFVNSVGSMVTEDFTCKGPCVS